MRTKIIKVPKGFEIDKPFVIADFNAIEDIIGEHKENLNCSVGGNTLTFTTVPVGKIWIVTNILAYVGAGIPTYIKIEAWRNGDIIAVRRKTTSAEGDEVVFSGLLIINGEDIIKCYFSGMLAGNDIYADLVGYQIKRHYE